MKKLAIVVLLLLLVGVLFTSGYQAQVSMPASVQISEPGEGMLDCYQHQEVIIEAGKKTPAKSFICCNHFPANAKLSVTSAHELVQTIAPSSPEIVSGNCPKHPKEFNVVYDARGFDPGTYEVPFYVSADIDNAHVEFTFYVSVEIT